MMQDPMKAANGTAALRKGTLDTFVNDYFTKSAELTRVTLDIQKQLDVDIKGDWVPLDVNHVSYQMRLVNNRLDEALHSLKVIQESL